jgi:glycosyltransferase involved in cell wall biosynthesis
MRMTAGSDSPHTLHAGPLDLPFLWRPGNQRHYLFCDTTWRLCSAQASFTSECSSRLLRDAARAEARTYRQMKHIFPTSQYVKEDLVANYGVPPEKVTVVGTGRGIIQPFHGAKDYTNGKILYVAKGRFEDKGGPMVLAAFERARQMNPRLQLTIVGQDSYMRELQLPNVTTYGFVSVEELQRLFNTHSLFLMPAINEPWGLVYLEAMACRMPIVGLNRNAFPELSGGGKYGFGLDQPDPGELARVILDAFSRPEMTARMGNAAQIWCLETFTWEKTVARIVDTINMLAVRDQRVREVKHGCTG